MTLLLSEILHSLHVEGHGEQLELRLQQLHLELELLEDPSAMIRPGLLFLNQLYNPNHCKIKIQ